jgi:hypothetical protein
MPAPAAQKPWQHARRHLYPTLLLTLCLAHHLTLTSAAGCDVGSYSHYPSVTSPGGDLPLASPPSRFTPQSLATLCNKTPGCVAFDSLGNLKSSVDLGSLKQVPNALGLACFGLYVNRDESAGSRWLGFRVEPRRMAQHLQVGAAVAAVCQAVVHAGSQEEGDAASSAAPALVVAWGVAAGSAAGRQQHLLVPTEDACTNQHWHRATSSSPHRLHCTAAGLQLILRRVQQPDEERGAVPQPGQRGRGEGGGSGRRAGRRHEGRADCAAGVRCAQLLLHW